MGKVFYRFSIKHNELFKHFKYAKANTNKKRFPGERKRLRQLPSDFSLMSKHAGRYASIVLHSTPAEFDVKIHPTS